MPSSLMNVLKLKIPTNTEAHARNEGREERVDVDPGNAGSRRESVKRHARGKKILAVRAAIYR